MPLQRRVPKFGFKNINRKEYTGINIDTIQNLVDSKKIKKELTLDNIILLQLAGKNDLVKILGRGKIDVPVKVSAHKFSASAKKAIENAGGEVISI
jgi:large subunit ribosomal protein L15